MKNVKFCLLTLFEVFGLFRILVRTIPYIIRIMEQEELLAPTDFYNVTISGIFIFLISFSIKKWFNIELKTEYKNNILSYTFEFIGRILLIVLAVFVTQIYFHSWFKNWYEGFSLIYIPTILVVFFLAFKECETIWMKLKK